MRPWVGVIRDVGNLLWVQTLEPTPYICRTKKEIMLLSLNKNKKKWFASVAYTNFWEICLWELAGIDHIN